MDARNPPGPPCCYIMIHLRRWMLEPASRGAQTGTPPPSAEQQHRSDPSLPDVQDGAIRKKSLYCMCGGEVCTSPTRRSKFPFFKYFLTDTLSAFKYRERVMKGLDASLAHFTAACHSLPRADVTPPSSPTHQTFFSSD